MSSNLFLLFPLAVAVVVVVPAAPATIVVAATGGIRVYAHVCT